MKFRRKPTIIEAYQFDGIHDVLGVLWEQNPTSERYSSMTPYVITIHGQRCYIVKGDWIVQEPDGIHYYPIKDEIMKLNYEQVKE